MSRGTATTFILGGTRSGKSAVAERLAARSGEPVTYLATASVDPDDADHMRRIEAHRTRRPREWTTIECPHPADLPDALDGTDGTVLVDSLGTWVTGHPTMEPDQRALVAALTTRSGRTIVVSEEVGLAVHPPTELGRKYVDALGTLNQAVASIASSVLLVVAGRVLELHELPGEDAKC